MKILSLFDGISCARVALERSKHIVERYFASEIDKYAIQISQKNYPDIIQLGSVVGLVPPKEIDLLIGGSPCQDLSIAKNNRKGLEGSRSGLFWEYVRILHEAKPKYFILENVNSMPREAKDIITKTLGVEPIMIDAALVSAQRRKRLFWVGKWNGEKYETVTIPQPEDRGIFLKDILEDGNGISVSEQVVGRKRQPDGSWKRELEPRDDNKSSALTSNMNRSLILMDKSKTIRVCGRGGNPLDRHNWDSVYQYRRTYWRETKGGKVPTLTANMGTGGNNVPYVQGAASRTWPRTPNGKKREKRIELNGIPKANSMTLVQGDSMVAESMGVRKLTPVECERLQSLPDNYTEGVSNTQRYRALGNAFNVDVVAHILSFIPKC